jgi:hypothetical protein
VFPPLEDVFVMCHGKLNWNVLRQQKRPFIITDRQEHSHVEQNLETSLKVKHVKTPCCAFQCGMLTQVGLPWFLGLWPPNYHREKVFPFIIMYRLCIDYEVVGVGDILCRLF